MLSFVFRTSASYLLWSASIRRKRFAFVFCSQPLLVIFLFFVGGPAHLLLCVGSIWDVLLFFFFSNSTNHCVTLAKIGI